MERPTLFTDLRQYIVRQRDRHWQQQVEKIDDEILDFAAATFDVYAIEELRKIAREKGDWAERTDDRAEQRKIDAVRAGLDKIWTPNLFLGQISKADLVIRNWTTWSACPAGPTSGRSRSSIASTCWPPACGRTIGVKVFGSDLDQDPEGFRRGGRGPPERAGRGERRSRPESRARAIWRSRLDRERAARYGVNVGDI